MDYLSHNVSENLKKIRKAKGISLEFETDQPHVYRKILNVRCAPQERISSLRSKEKFYLK